MKTALWAQAEALFTPAEAQRLRQLATLTADEQYRYTDMCLFDAALGGPGLHNMNTPGTEVGATGRYDFRDRDVFRPIQYCAWHFQMKDPQAVPWLTRTIVQDCGLHLAGLTKRVAFVWREPLGTLLGRLRGHVKIDQATWTQLKAFSQVYHAAKDDLTHAKATHQFSPGDAVVAYFVSRRLAHLLYPHVRLMTPWTVWDDPGEWRELPGADTPGR
jgi:hypothetical protein